MTRPAHDFIDPDTGKWVKEYAIAPRYTPKWMLVDGKEATWPTYQRYKGSKRVPHGTAPDYEATRVVPVGEEPDVVQIAFPALDDLEEFLTVSGYGPGYMPPGNEWIDKKTIEWRNALLTPKGVATGYRSRATTGYRGDTWEAIIKNTNVYFDGSPVAWYDLDGGFVRYATLWDLAHLKQGELMTDLDENNRLWLLSEKQWDEADFPPPIEDGPPFVRGVTVGGDRREARDVGRQVDAVLAPLGAPKWLLIKGDQIEVSSTGAPENWEFLSIASWNEFIKQLHDHRDAQDLYREAMGYFKATHGGSPVSPSRREARAADGLEAFAVLHQGSPVWWVHLDNGPVQAASLFDILALNHRPQPWYVSRIATLSGNYEYEVKPKKRDSHTKGRKNLVWLMSLDQWDNAEFPPESLGGPPFVKNVSVARDGRMREMREQGQSKHEAEKKAERYRQEGFPNAGIVELSNGMWVASRGRHRRGASDYPDLEAALLGAQSKFDATHAIARGNNFVIFSPSSRGYLKRVGFREKGFYHWPEKGELVADLPPNAEMIHTLIDSGWDPEAAPEVEHRRAAEDAAEIRSMRFEEIDPAKLHEGDVIHITGGDSANKGKWGKKLDALARRGLDMRWIGPMHYRVVKSSAGETREEARENPIDTGDGVPWVKIARDPEQYKEAMKEADAIGPIDDPKKVYELLGPALLKEDQECFVVVLLDVRQQCRGVAEVHRGSRSRVSTSLVDILRVVLKSGAEGFVVVHNHPSGKASPSEADKDLTKAISKSAELFDGDLTFVDHVICGNGQYYSFADKKLFHAKGEKKRKLKRKAA